MSQEKIPDNNLPFYIQNYNVNIVHGEEVAGKVLYTTVGSIPSNNPLKPVWQLILTGYLKPNVEKYSIIYDFSESNYRYKNTVSFENIASGTFNLCGHVLDASKIIGFNYTYSDADSKLTIELDTKKWDFQLKKESLFSYQLNLDDSDPCSSEITKSYTLAEDIVVASAGGFIDVTCTEDDVVPWVIDQTNYSEIQTGENGSQIVFVPEGSAVDPTGNNDNGSLYAIISVSSSSKNYLFIFASQVVVVDINSSTAVALSVSNIQKPLEGGMQVQGPLFDATFYPIAAPTYNPYKLTSSSITAQGNVTSPYGWTINGTNYSSIESTSSATYFSPLRINSNTVEIAFFSSSEEISGETPGETYEETYEQISGENLLSIGLNDSKTSNGLTITITEIDAENNTFTATFSST